MPDSITVLITARRLDGVPQPDGSTVIGFPSQITYDVEGIERDHIYRKQNVTPSDRIVAPDGDPVRIRAASARSSAEVEILGTEERLFVREGLVFDGCEEEP